jgi:two-component system sensor histidine kinase HydH
MLLSWRTRRLLNVGPMLSLWILVAATVHDALVIGGAFSSPYLLVSAFLVVMLVIGAGIIHRLVQDARELARISSELADTQALLVHRERLAAVGEVAAVVAHEVRNPLAVLFNVVSQLRHQLAPEHPGRALVEMAAEESERLALLVSELLEFTSPQSPRIARCDLQEVLQTAVNAALTSTRLAASQVRIEAPEDEGLIEADEALLYRAVVNLVMNALQAPGRSEPVRVRATLDAEHGVRIDVEDEGDGVPEPIAEKIFEPFFTTRATGTGLGLSLARRAAEAHGGTLILRSRAGQGACFRLSLPPAGAGLAEGSGPQYQRG